MEEERNQKALDAIGSAKDLVIHSIAETMDLYGVTPSAGRLYGTMYFHDEMTLDEMKDELQMSKPSMSTAVKTLQEINMVYKSWKKGSRRDVFYAEKDFFKSFFNFFCMQWEREVKLNLQAIKSAQQKLKEVMDDTEVQEAIRDEASDHFTTLEESKKYYLWLSRLVERLRSEDIFNYLPVEEKED